MHTVQQPAWPGHAFNVSAKLHDLLPKCGREGCRDVHSNIRIACQKSLEPAGVITVIMRQHHRLHRVRVQAHVLHIGKQHGTIAAGIKQHGVTAALDQAGKAPAGRQSGPIQHVIEYHKQAMLFLLSRFHLTHCTGVWGHD